MAAGPIRIIPSNFGHGLRGVGPSAQLGASDKHSASVPTGQKLNPSKDTLGLPGEDYNAIRLHRVSTELLD